jgi:hypothetical protein
MVEIKQNQELNVENLLSYRGKIKQSDIENIGKDMEDYIKSKGGNRIGNPITVTYAVEDDMVDVELILPVDRMIASSEKFRFKDRIKIINAVVAEYIGNPRGLQYAANQLNTFIVEQKLQPITCGYNVTKKVDISNPDNTEIDLYVGINPNVL